MNVSLVHCTPDAERFIVRMARVSNPKNADNWDTGPKLLRYLIEHKHWSPFETASLCVCIETERDIAAQILRHRSLSFQEMSQRYTRTTLATAPELRRQDPTNRQNSIDDLDPEMVAKYRDRCTDLIVQSYSLYLELLEAGVAKECARRILPLATPTLLYAHGTLRSWIHYIQLRCSPDTQLEHRRVAQAIRAIFTEQFPIIAEAVFSEP